VEICLNRLAAMPGTRTNVEGWSELHGSLARAVQKLRNWSGDCATTITSSEVLFASSFILARLSAGKLAEESLGVERAFAIVAPKLPFPIDLTISPDQQAKA